MNAKSTLENEIEEYLVKKVEALGGLCLKLRPPTGRGYPDRTCYITDAPPFCVELKRPVGGKVAVHQIYWGGLLEGVGIPVYFCHTKESVDEMLEEIIFKNRT